jgi:hypothetical protein
MWQQVLMALGAGAASAVLFVVPAKGFALAIALGVLAPLPLLIAALGLAERLGVAAVAMGGLVIGFLIEPYAAGIYLLSVGAPALVLGFMARRPPYGEPGTLLLTIAVCATLAAWTGVGVVAFRYASLDAALEDLTTQLLPLAKSMIEATDAVSGGIDPRDFTRWVVLGMVPAAAAWGVCALCLNLWLGGRVANISGMLPRPWPDLPATLRLPRLAFALVGIALAACLAPGLIRLLAATALTALLLAFTVQGLATLHAMTRGRPARPAILAGFYALSLALFPWPLLLAAGLGLTDVARPLPRGATVPKPPLNKI